MQKKACDHCHKRYNRWYGDVWTQWMIEYNEDEDEVNKRSDEYLIEYWDEVRKRICENLIEDWDEVKQYIYKGIWGWESNE